MREDWDFSPSPRASTEPSQWRACSQAGCFFSVPCLWIVSCRVDLLLHTSVQPEQQFFRVGERIRVHCNHGFQKQGDGNLTCLASGRWDKSMPKCSGEEDSIESSIGRLFVVLRGFLILLQPLEGSEETGEGTFALGRGRSWSMLTQL